MQEWICHTCDSHLIKGGMPSIAAANSLELAPIPPELEELNVLERQLIVKILPFAKIVALPKGRQRAVHGAVVCVPSEVETTVNSLPRPSAEAQLLQVIGRSMKRTHDGTTQMPHSLRSPATQTEKWKPLQTQQMNGGPVTRTKKRRTSDLVWPWTQVLSYGDGIFSVAPAQGNKPVGFFSTPKLEAMAFPVQFPTGRNTLDEVRQVKLSPSRYFNTRLFCVDTQFAKDQSYFFFAQFVTETHMATCSMSIQTRRGRKMPGTAGGFPSRCSRIK
ncbi:hypothetical protein AAFF_G00345430 [Aldrovandia affinis]|uniref:DUF6570 domain-containing protein n=1 Tax=Aldrovandia affinis TaxID=143900 RepID=A0AAD7R684_9TELE|nr:hypothetical protein AAFF_G00345430 [Aldrovandia affinis]